MTNKEKIKKIFVNNSIPTIQEEVIILRIENEQLKKEISVLLSCKNCSENKGGYVCEKEYNDKCLSQKIEYIKELKEENAELKAHIEQLSNDNHVLKTSFIIQQTQIEKMKCCGNCKHDFENGEYCCNPLCTHFEEWEGK